VKRDAFRTSAAQEGNYRQTTPRKLRGSAQAHRQMDFCYGPDVRSPQSHPPPGRDRAEGEGEVTRNRGLLLGVAIGLFGALAVLTARYVAVVLAG
jgi:hypothetical protein